MLLTIDIGTSNFKAAIYDYDGNRLEFASCSLSINGDCDQWINAYHHCCQKLGSLQEIEAIVITGNGPTLVPVLEDDSTAEARLWLDSSAKNYQDEVSKIMGGFVDAKFFLPKVLKMKNEESETYTRTKHFLGSPEYLAYYLTKEARTVFPSDGFDRWFWNDKALQKLGLEPDKFPPFIRPKDKFGNMKNIPVISGGPDFFSAILGAGITEPGQALDRTGSSEGINLCTQNKIDDTRFMSYGHPIKPYWNLSSVIKFAGIKIQNICNSLGLSNADDFINMAEKNQSHAKSILENMCNEVKNIITMMEETGLTINELRVTGGLSCNEYLNQMKANITGKPVIQLENKEAELLGCAIIGSCALGKYNSYREACEKMVKVKNKYC